MRRLTLSALLAVLTFVSLPLAGLAHAEENATNLTSLSIKVVGVSFFGPSYNKRASLKHTTSGYTLEYTCSAPREKQCGCSHHVDTEINESQVRTLLAFIASLRDGGDQATCCDHPWTGIELEYLWQPRQTKTVAFDLLKLEEIFNLCGTPVVPFNADDSGSQFRLGKQLHKLGLDQMAVEALERAATLDPGHVALEAYETLGEAHWRLREYEKALNAFNRVLSLRPNDARILLRLAALHSDFDRKQEAIEAYKHALDLYPTRDTKVEAYSNLGHIYKELGRLSEASRAFKEAIQIQPDNAFTRFSLGEVDLELGDAEAALEQYQALTLLKSNYADDLHLMIYQRAIHDNPEDPNAHFNLGNTYYLAGRYEDAIEPYKQAIRLRPNLQLAYSRLGYSYVQVGKYGEAVEAYEGAVRVDPQSYIDHTNLGLAYLYVGSDQPGIAHLKEAIHVKPESADAHNNLGYGFRSTGRDAEAIAPLKQAIHLEPDHKLAHFNLGMVYRNIGRYEDAVRSLKRAIRLDPEDPERHFYLGNTYHDMKRHKEAVGPYKEAVNLKPNFVEARFQLGVTYLELGERKAAVQEYEELKSWDEKRAKELYSLISQ